MSIRRPQWLAVATALIVVVFFFVLGNQFNLFEPVGTTQKAAVNQKNMQDQNSQAQGQSNTQGTVQPDQGPQMPPGLGVVDEVVGTGVGAQAGDTVTVHYTGKFTDGKVFDSSIPRGQPFSFTLGAGQVIAGWDYGVAGMKVGGKRKLNIPADLGYGPNDYNGIPGNSTLLFDVELLNIQRVPLQ